MDQHFRHTFTTDSSGNFVAEGLARTPGGMMMRIQLERTDGQTGEVAVPAVELVSIADGEHITPVYQNSVNPGSFDNGIYAAVAPGELALSITSGGDEIEYRIGFWIVDSQMRRHRVHLATTEETPAAASHSFVFEGGTLMSLGVIGDEAVDGDSVQLDVHVRNSDFPLEVDEDRLGNFAKDVNANSDASIWEYIPPGTVTVTIHDTGWTDPTEVTVLFDADIE